MKKKLLHGCALACALAAAAPTGGCKSDDPAPGPGGEENLKVTALRESAGENEYALWPAGSRIGIYLAGETDHGLDLSQGSGTAEAVFGGKADGADPRNLVAYCPFPGPGAAEGRIGFSIPAVQPCADGKADPAALPMAACGDASGLRFRNLYGILRLGIGGAEGISRLTLRSLAGQALAGTAEIKVSETASADAPQAVIIPQGASESIEVEVSGNASEFDIVLLPGTYEALELTVESAEGQTVLTPEEPVRIGRSEITRMQLETVREPEPENLNDPARYGLSGDPAYANCYPVGAPGRYSFAPVKPDGSPTGTVSADWLWSERAVPSGDALISDVELRDGRILFTAGAARGNALIIGYDADWNIVWSWHIWLTGPTEDLAFGDGNAYMSLDLGAATAVPGENPSPGLKYQWGRKDPFPAGPESETVAFAEAYSTIALNGGFQWGAEPVSPQSDAAYSCGRPTTFIYDPTGDNRYDWHYQRNDELWGEAKTVYDPCPPGYKVPAYGAWNDMDEDNFVWDDTLRGRLYSAGGTESWFAAGGVRWGDADSGLLGDVRNDGYYWLSTAYNDNGRCLTFNTGWIVPNDYFGRANGMSIRCAKDI